MPNDAKLGLFVGMVVVVALAVIYHGKGQSPAPEAAVQRLKQLATWAPAGALDKQQSETGPASSSVPGREELRRDKLGGKEDPAQRVNGDPDAPDQKPQEENRT